MSKNYSLQEMRASLEESITDYHPNLEMTFKSMFGGVLGYMHGHAAASLSNIGLALKLSPSDQEELLKMKGTARLRYEPDQPESKQYIVLPNLIVDDNKSLAAWIDKCSRYLQTLPPPKPKKPKK